MGTATSSVLHQPDKGNGETVLKENSKNALFELGGLVNDETLISCFGSNVTALSGSYAIRIFHAGTLRNDGSVWMVGLSILYHEQGGSNVGVWCVGFTVPAYIQDCSWENGVERD